ncbi:hypothetical protein K501DRAFT_338483 [Backusella circina FSU 941]|nr:hypothetical protein K501DRAFT_338483 [Backusella circina FSU 941]
MSDFGDFSTSQDPTSDFLARERAVLGGDADLFTDSSAFDEQFPPTISATPGLDSTQTQFTEYNSTSLISTPANDYSVFESDFPKAENLETSKAFHKAMLPDEEPEVVRQWREKQSEVIAKRDEEEREKKHAVLNRAREDIDKFYEDYNDKKQRSIEENREREEQHLKAREATSSSSNVWERVSKEFDVSNAKAAFPTKDVSRMKGIMLDLRKDSNAPGTIVA